MTDVVSQAYTALMGAGVWNIVMGLVAIGAGASGKVVFIGTDSGLLLMVVGGVFVVWGAYQIVRDRRARG